MNTPMSKVVLRAKPPMNNTENDNVRMNCFMFMQIYHPWSCKFHRIINQLNRLLVINNHFQLFIQLRIEGETKDAGMNKCS